MEEETYKLKVYCSNCDYGRNGYLDKGVETEIPKGISFSDWARAEECPRCGCRDLERV